MEDVILAAVEFAARLIAWVARSEYAPWVVAALAAAMALGYEGRAGSGWWRALWQAFVAGLVGWGVIWFVQTMTALAGW